MASNLLNLKAQGRIISALKNQPKELQKIAKVNPRDRYVALFPSHESVHVGMGFHLLNSEAAEKVYMEASEQLNKNILKLCLEGPKENLLNSLENRSVAAFVTSHATMAKLGEEYEYRVKFCKSSAGIGIGLVNSLIFGGGMTFSDGLDLVHKQARAMDRVVKLFPSAKVKIRIRPATRLYKVCQAAIEHCLNLNIPPELAICSVSAYLSQHKIEIGGHEEAIKYLETDGLRLFEFYRIQRVLNLPFASNTALMEPVKVYTKLYINSKLEQNPDYIKEPTTCSVHSATCGHHVSNSKHIIRDICDYPTRPLKVQQVLGSLFTRPKKLPQPNVLVLWDRRLMVILKAINERAARSARLLNA